MTPLKRFGAALSKTIVPGCCCVHGRMESREIVRDYIAENGFAVGTVGLKDSKIETPSEQPCGVGCSESLLICTEWEIFV